MIISYTWIISINTSSISRIPYQRIAEGCCSVIKINFVSLIASCCIIHNGAVCDYRRVAVVVNANAAAVVAVSASIIAGNGAVCDCRGAVVVNENAAAVSISIIAGNGAVGDCRGAGVNVNAAAVAISIIASNGAVCDCRVVAVNVNAAVVVSARYREAVNR